MSMGGAHNNPVCWADVDAVLAEPRPMVQRALVVQANRSSNRDTHVLEDELNAS